MTTKVLKLSRLALGCVFLVNLGGEYKVCFHIMKIDGTTVQGKGSIKHYLLLGVRHSGIVPLVQA